MVRRRWRPRPRRGAQARRLRGEGRRKGAGGAPGRHRRGRAALRGTVGAAARAGAGKMGEGLEVVKGSCVLISCDMQVSCAARHGAALAGAGRAEREY